MILIWLLLYFELLCYETTEAQTYRELGFKLKWYNKPGVKLPKLIELELYLNKGTIKLELQREKDNVQKVEVFAKYKLKDNERIKSSALYKDPSKHAAFSVGITEERVIYYGEFVYKKNVYTLMPTIGDKSENQKSYMTPYEVSLNYTKHYIRKDRVHNGTTGDDASSSPRFNKKDILINKADYEARKLFPTYKDGKILYTIEIMVILDFSVYNKWLDIAQNDAGATISNLKQYYAHVINGIKERYELIVMPKVAFSASMAGLYILDTKKKAEFIEVHKANPTGLFTERALYATTDWVNAERKTFPEFDVAALFTSYALLPHYNGYAHIGAACTAKGVSINRDVGSFDTIFAATHEIGHNMGASHDSVNNYCKHEDQYIMSKGRFGFRGNYFTFSSCSLDYFSKFTDFLNMRKIMCLTNLPASVYPENTDQYLNQHPGQKMTLDKQCKAVFGATSSFCGGDTEDSICMRMSCFIAPGVCTETPAAEGTSCGNKQWCHRTKCETDTRAPQMKKVCPFGEYKGPMDYDLRKYKDCAELVNKQPFVCYQEYYYKRCCESCDKLAKTKTKKCPYGNVHSSCDPKGCYAENYGKECCETCEGAKYKDGKLAEVCSNEKFDNRCEVVTGRECYTPVGKICCNTCEVFRVNIKGCKYGDKATWCRDRIRRNPDDCKNYKTECCHSCHNKKY